MHLFGVKSLNELRENSTKTFSNVVQNKTTKLKSKILPYSATIETIVSKIPYTQRILHTDHRDG